MKPKNLFFERRSVIPLLLVIFLVCQTCILDSGDDRTVLRDVSGTLIWGGSPAQDGSGILFETTDTTYGAPGVKSDYANYFSGDESRAQVSADIQITGKTVVRGWGAEYPEIRFLSISRE